MSRARMSIYRDASLDKLRIYTVLSSLYVCLFSLSRVVFEDVRIIACCVNVTLMETATRVITNIIYNDITVRRIASLSIVTHTYKMHRYTSCIDALTSLLIRYFLQRLFIINKRIFNVSFI